MTDEIEVDAAPQPPIPAPPDTFAAVMLLLAAAVDAKACAARLRELQDTIAAANQVTAQAESAKAELANRERELAERAAELDARAAKLDEREEEVWAKDREHKQHWDRIAEACDAGRAADKVLLHRLGVLGGLIDPGLYGTLTQNLPDWSAIERELGVAGRDPHYSEGERPESPLAFELEAPANLVAGSSLSRSVPSGQPRSAAARRSMRRAVEGQL